MHILRYVSDTGDQAIQFPNMIYLDSLVVYLDADCAEDLDISRPTTGYIVYLWGAQKAWQLRLQPTVATSKMESEYRTAHDTIQEVA